MARLLLVFFLVEIIRMSSSLEQRVAELVRSARRVVILSGAGVSTAAGVPDFRSPGGMYDTLRPELLTASESDRKLMERDPTYVVEKNLFLRSQGLPYHEVRRPFILGTKEKRWKPTLFHRFVERLDQEKQLQVHITQNIDGLDFATQVDPEKICPCHGSIANVACESCGKPVSSYEDYCQKVRTQIKDIYSSDASKSSSTPITCEFCGKPHVKPTTVLFGSSLPESFFRHLETTVPQADLLLIVGTSLLVSPANFVVKYVNCPRVLVNKDLVGTELGLRLFSSSDSGRSSSSSSSRIKKEPTLDNSDFFLQGDCDLLFARIMHRLDWLLDVPDDTLPPTSLENKRLVTAEEASS